MSEVEAIAEKFAFIIGAAFREYIMGLPSDDIHAVLMDAASHGTMIDEGLRDVMKDLIENHGHDATDLLTGYTMMCRDGRAKYMKK